MVFISSAAKFSEFLLQTKPFGLQNSTRYLVVELAMWDFNVIAMATSTLEVNSIFSFHFDFCYSGCILKHIYEQLFQKYLGIMKLHEN